MIRYCENYWKDVERVLSHIRNIEALFGRSVFVTGATGMICSSVIELLWYLNHSRKAEIRIEAAGRNIEKTMRRFYPLSEGLDYHFVKYDSSKSDTLSVSPDFVIHGAGYGDPEMISRQPVEVMLSNITGLETILRCACSNDTKRVLYISSSEVYGNKEENGLFSENMYGYLDILKERASYPSSKRAGESLCVAYQSEYNLNTVIVRPGHIYGPSITDSDSRASAQFTRACARGENITMKSAGLQKRSYCYTLDCASAIITAMINGERGNAYNISNSDSICTIRDMAYALADESGVNVIFENASDMEKKSYNLMNNSALSSEKLEMLGWKAEFSLKEGVKKTLSYYINSY